MKAKNPYFVDQRELVKSIKHLVEEKQKMLSGSQVKSNLHNFEIGMTPDNGAVVMYCKGFPVQIHFPKSESIHLVVQYEHLSQPKRFRGYDKDLYDYEGTLIGVLPHMSQIGKIYGLELSLPKSGLEYKLHIKSVKENEMFINACISFLNKMVTNSEICTPRKPKTIK
jgi:hypothetical protein